MPLMQQQIRPPFLCLAQKSSQVTPLCGASKLSSAQKQSRSEEVCMLMGHMDPNQ